VATQARPNPFQQRRPAQQQQQQQAPQAFEEEVVPESVADDSVIDLTEVQQPKFEILPPGVYDAVVDDVEFTHSQSSGNPMLTWTLRVSLDDGRERTLFYHTTLTETGLPRLKRAVEAIAPDADLSAFRPREASGLLAGRPCRIKIKNRMYDGQQRNNVNDILPPENSDGFMG
jgi:hypothetical protein